MSSLLLVALLALPHGADEPFEPPKIKRPDNFHGAVGRFRIQSGASPTTIPARKPIRLVVTITADESVPVLAPPSRLPLEKDEEFRALFDFDTPQPAQRQQGKKWEFYYLLKPRTEKVKEVPEITFCYFNPTFRQDPRGYEEKITDAIPITVTPAAVEPVIVQNQAPLEIPSPALGVFVDDASVLQDHQRWHLPSVGWLIALLLAPPLAALVWLLVWRHLYPDAARRAKLRRSRAARTALAALHHARSGDPAKSAVQINLAIASYLHERLDLVSATPTPIEVDSYLRGMGVPDAMRERTSALFQTCDALRFSAVPPAVSESLTTEAEQVILALEARTWSLLSS